MAGKGDNIIKSLVDRIRNVNEEIKGLQDDRKVIFAEAKVHGINVKVLREAMRIADMDNDARAERSDLLAQYGEALGYDLL